MDLPWTDSEPDRRDVDELRREAEGAREPVAEAQEEREPLVAERDRVRDARAAHEDEASFEAGPPDHLRQADEIEAAAQRAEQDLAVDRQLGVVSEQEAEEKEKEIEAQRQEAEELRSRLDDLNERVEEIDQIITERARDALRPHVELVRELARREVDALAHVVEGDDPLPAGYETYIECRQERLEAQQTLQNLRLKARGNDAAVNRAQQQRLEGMISEPFEDVPPAASLGLLVTDLMTYARRADSPWMEVFEETDLGQADGSIHHSTPVGATSDFLLAAERDALPADTSL